MKTITAFLNVRTQSSRCPNKMLRPYAGSSLFKIALQKLKFLDVDEKFVCARDKIFLNQCEGGSGIKTYERSLESVTIDGPLIKVFESFKVFTSDYVLFLNPCHAFLQVDTIQRAIDLFKRENYVSMTAVERIKDWIFDTNGDLLTKQDLFHMDTKKTKELFRAAHAFHFYDRHRFLENSGLIFKFEYNDPYLFEIPTIEAIDVDDDDDFIISEAAFKAFGS